MKRININERSLRRIIKESIDNILNTDENKINTVIDTLSYWDWTVDNSEGNRIFAHLSENPSLKVVVEINGYDVKIKEIHFVGDNFDTSYCIDLKYLSDKLSELDF